MYSATRTLAAVALACLAAGCSTPARPVAAPDGMVRVAGRTFLMGSEAGMADEAPAHRVAVAAFSIDAREVTVAEFARFAAATGYVTDAERFGWSAVFDRAAGEWRRVDGADWRHPEGVGSSAATAEPVTQVSWNDAERFAAWAGKRLPTEAEFECAARGGLEGKAYAWGDELEPGGRPPANWWQGEFPTRDTSADGFAGRAPAGSFPPNGYGLYDMTGNVWEWCSDRFGERYYAVSPGENPRGPDAGEERVIRGGSWMCASNYCQGYRLAARSHATPDSGMNNLGFRCAHDE